MRADSYRVFKMNVTKEELKTITDFCQFLDEIIEEQESIDIAREIIEGIASYDNELLKIINLKINVEEEK